MPEPLKPALIYLALLAISVAAGRLVAGPLTGARTHSTLERLLLYWLLGIIALSWVGTILAAMGYFRWWLVLGLVLALGAFSIWRAGRRPQLLPSQPAPTPWPALLLVVVLLGGAAWLFARPAESYLLTDDSAVYTLGGIVLAREGKLPFEPADIYQFDDLSVEGGFWDPAAVQTGDVWLSRKDFLRQFGEIDMAGVFSRHYGPFYQWTLARQTLEIGFLPLPKVWIAFGVWLFGPGRATWATPFLGLTGIAALYGIVRRTLGWKSALAASLLLAVSLPQVWFSRLPISEIPTQALLLAGLYLAIMARHEAADPHAARPLAIWSALGLGSLAILRFEGLPLLAALEVLVWLFWRRSHMSRDITRLWLGVLTISGLCGFAMSAAVAPYYLFTRAIALLSPSTVRLLAPLLAAMIAGLAAIYSLRRHAPDRFQALATGLERYIAPACAGAWILWGVIALVRIIGSPLGGSLAGWLVQYWTRPGLLLSVLGALALFWSEYRRGERPELAAWLGLAAFLLLGFSVSALVTPVHPWAMRRLVPVVMPALAIGIPSLLATVYERLPLAFIRGKARQAGGMIARLAAAALLALLAFGIAQRTRPLVLHQERRGLWQGLVAFSQRFPTGAVLLFDDAQVSRRLTQPMELVFGHPSFVLQDSKALRSETPMVDGLIEQALAQGRPVYLVVTQGEQPGLLSGWQLASRGASSLDTDLLAMPWGRLPQDGDIIRQSLPLDIYEVLPRAQEAGMPAFVGTLDIPVGPGSYPYLYGGFYPWALDETATAVRWTRGMATVRAPWPGSDAALPATFCLRIDLSNWRGDGKPLDLAVEAEGRQVFTDSLALPMARQMVNIPISRLENEGPPDLEIRLYANTWTPQDPRDQRELGMLVYGVQLAPADQCPQR